MLSKVAEFLFVLLLVAGVPVLSFLTTRRSQIRVLPRQALYFSAVLSQWLLGAVGAVFVLLSPWTFRQAGFRPVAAAAFFYWVIVLSAVSLAALVIFLLLERRGWWPAESDLVYMLLPETPREKLWCVLVLAPTAALCEEFLYRGYLLAQLSVWLHSASWGWGASSLAFGLAHAYQGASGMTRAALLGALLAYPVLRLQTLLPSMAAHFLIDAVALAWLGPAFLRRKPAI